MHVNLTFPVPYRIRNAAGQETSLMAPGQAGFDIQEVAKADAPVAWKLRHGDIPLTLDYHAIDGRLYVETGRYGVKDDGGRQQRLTDEMRDVPFKGTNGAKTVRERVFDEALMGSPFIVREPYYYWTPNQAHYTNGGRKDPRRMKNVEILSGSHDRTILDIADWLRANARAVEGRILVAAPTPVVALTLRRWQPATIDPFGMTRGSNRDFFYRVDLAKEIATDFRRALEEREGGNLNVAELLELTRLEIPADVVPMFPDDAGVHLARCIATAVLQETSRGLSVATPETFAQWRALRAELASPRKDAGSDLELVGRALGFVRLMHADMGKTAPVQTAAARIAFPARIFNEHFRPRSEAALRERETERIEIGQLDEEALALDL